MAISNADRTGVALAALVAWLASAAFATAQLLPSRPSPAQEAFVGEYVDAGFRVIVRENRGKLEWSDDAGKTFHVLQDLGRDSYASETKTGAVLLKIDRGPNSKIQGLAIGPRFLARVDPSTDGVFRIKPIRPLSEIRREAAAAQPPEETGDFLPTNLVEVRKLEKTILQDVRYAGTANFLSAPVYEKAKVMLQREAALSLLRVHRSLHAQGLGLLLHDGYRPWSVTKIFWEATPPERREFVADPSKGSKHNRGCAVDLTLYDFKTKKPVMMPSLYDEMSPRAYPEYPGGTSRERALRDTLRRAMEHEGFTVNESEWWHFDCKDWQRYRIGNLPLR